MTNPGSTQDNLSWVVSVLFGFVLFGFVLFQIRFVFVLFQFESLKNEF